MRDKFTEEKGQLVDGREEGFGAIVDPFATIMITTGNAVREAKYLKQTHKHARTLLPIVASAVCSSKYGPRAPS